MYPAMFQFGCSMKAVILECPKSEHTRVQEMSCSRKPLKLQSLGRYEMNLVRFETYSRWVTFRIFIFHFRTEILFDFIRKLFTLTCISYLYIYIYIIHLVCKYICITTTKHGYSISVNYRDWRRDSVCVPQSNINMRNDYCLWQAEQTAVQSQNFDHFFWLWHFCFGGKLSLPPPSSHCQTYLEYFT